MNFLQAFWQNLSLLSEISCLLSSSTKIYSSISLNLLLLFTSITFLLYKLHDYQAVHTTVWFFFAVTELFMIDFSYAMYNIHQCVFPDTNVLPPILLSSALPASGQTFFLSFSFSSFFFYTWWFAILLFKGYHAYHFLSF